MGRNRPEYAGPQEWVIFAPKFDDVALLVFFALVALALFSAANFWSSVPIPVTVLRLHLHHCLLHCLADALGIIRPRCYCRLLRLVLDLGLDKVGWRNVGGRVEIAFKFCGLLSRKVDPVPPAACRGQGSTAQGGRIAGRVSRDPYPVASKVAGSVVETLAPSMVCL